VYVDGGLEKGKGILRGSIRADSSVNVSFKKRTLETVVLERET